VPEREPLGPRIRQLRFHVSTASPPVTVTARYGVTWEEPLKDTRATDGGLGESPPPGGDLKPIPVVKEGVR
jgi:hypothetical protein